MIKLSDIILENLDFSVESRGSHHGQSDLTLIAKRGDTPVGKIDYSVYNGEPAVQWIESFEKRSGVATEMAKHLQSLYPDHEIDWGVSSSEGSAFINKLPVTYIPNQEHKELTDKLFKLKREEDKLIKISDAFNKLVDTNPDKANIKRKEVVTKLDRLNQISDEIWNIEQRLRDLKPGKNLIQKEAMDIPPAIYSPRLSLDKSFLDYMKSVENENRVGFDKSKKLWFPYANAEKGNVVIAYGHKSESPEEAARLKMGITEQEAEQLLYRDLEEAKEIIDRYIKKQYGVNLILDKDQTEMLSDFVFNMGRGAFNKFPKFVDAVLRKDWDTVKKEYERSASGNKLRKRNRYFFQRYLSKV